jgi:hypothetical protein
VSDPRQTARQPLRLRHFLRIEDCTAKSSSCVIRSSKVGRSAGPARTSWSPVFGGVPTHRSALGIGTPLWFAWSAGMPGSFTLHAYKGCEFDLFQHKTLASDSIHTRKPGRKRKVRGSSIPNFRTTASAINPVQGWAGVFRSPPA